MADLANVVIAELHCKLRHLAGGGAEPFFHSTIAAGGDEVDHLLEVDLVVHVQCDLDKAQPNQHQHWQGS